MTRLISTLLSPAAGTKHWRRERGATMVEYAIMASLVAAVCAATVQMLGTEVAGLFTELIGKF